MSETPTPMSQPPRRWRRVKQVAAAIGVLLVIYVAMAYLMAPAGWIWYAHRHPSLDDIPTITETHADIPGDPLNVALIGTELEVKRIMLKANWFPADPLTLRSCLEIATASVLKRKYDDAPVSNLYLFGRKQDLAFEKPFGDNPRKRNHVRFWRSPDVDPDGRPVWVGSATFDERVGISHTTAQVTHHIAPDIDAERDLLFQDLRQTGDLAEVYTVDGFQKTREGRNGGGDPWHTDGNLYVGVIGQSP
jgi:LssY C-terminus